MVLDVLLSQLDLNMLWTFLRSASVSFSALNLYEYYSVYWKCFKRSLAAGFGVPRLADKLGSARQSNKTLLSKHDDAIDTIIVVGIELLPSAHPVGFDVSFHRTNCISRGNCP